MRDRFKKNNSKAAKKPVEEKKSKVESKEGTTPLVKYTLHNDKMNFDLNLSYVKWSASAKVETVKDF
jgi:hypothetical protein